MPRRKSTLLLVLCVGVCFSAISLAQKPEKSARKILISTKPSYPQTLKNLHIEGLVRLKATITPNGNVANVEVIGGNPILVENAIKAVKTWKYAPGPAETQEEVVLNFFDR